MLRNNHNTLRNTPGVACYVALPAPAYAYAYVPYQGECNVGTRTLGHSSPADPWQGYPQDGLTLNTRTRRPAHGCAHGLSCGCGVPIRTSSPRSMALNSENGSQQGATC